MESSVLPLEFNGNTDRCIIQSAVSQFVQSNVSGAVDASASETLLMLVGLFITRVRYRAGIAGYGFQPSPAQPSPAPPRPAPKTHTRVGTGRGWDFNFNPITGTGMPRPSPPRV
ncbi:hypothetical protein CK203_039868 [Vitis vinifera]|uniref:Uncharacterized protein n=1 Tax=Vitis vinifera TaxID=29760 RepID=A0A438HQ99_VITVI|nr:hypothetical protein CK203_039868 [Vitis vinifera]